MSQVKNFILSIGLTLTPFLAIADCADNALDVQVISARCGGETVERRDERVPRKFKLKDFEGNWAISIRSVGGVTGEEAIGYSFKSNGQLSFNKCGIGVINHFDSVIYDGVPGELIHTTLTPGVATLLIEITDPRIGVGRITITDPEQGGVVQVVEFVAIRYTRTGKVLELLGHGISSFPTTRAVSSYTLIRQDVEL